jgi:pimeloyl-ACP methyl ester carboxylesterase
MLLSRAGVDVLRFDYHGTGDSAGEATDGDAAAWAGDVSTAIEELKDTAGADRVGLVGLRLGATLAATAAAERDDVDAVALWDPVVDGSCYVRELVALAGEARAGEGTEVLGFPLTPAMVRSIEELRLVPVLPSLPQRSLVVVTDARAEHAPLAAAVGTRVLERVPAAPPWTEEGNSGVGAMPVEVLQRLARWWS